MDLLYISLFFGLLSCVFVTGGFSYETYHVYKSKTSKTLTTGSLILQILATTSGAICAGLNIYLSGIENLPFLLTNCGILINLILLVIMKYKFRDN